MTLCSTYLVIASALVSESWSFFAFHFFLRLLILFTWESLRFFRLEAFESGRIGSSGVIGDLYSKDANALQ